MSLKRFMKKIIYRLPPHLVKRLYLIYFSMAYPELAEKRKSFGEKNPDKIFYVIRPKKNSVEGLMALMLYVLQQIGYAEKKGYIPIVDFKNYSVQYTREKGEDVWEVFFEQICEYSLKEVYQSKHVVLCGIDAVYQTYSFLSNKSFYSSDLRSSHKMVEKYIKFSEQATELFAQELKYINPSKSVGLYLRGTDYTKLKPAGESVQPSVEQAVERVNIYLGDEGINDIFLVTEDNEIYEKVIGVFGSRVKTVTFDRYIKDFRARDFLSRDESLNQLSDDPHIRGVNYLVKIMLLSKCAYIVGGKTCGSWAASVFADDSTKVDVFELGDY